MRRLIAAVVVDAAAGDRRLMIALQGRLAELTEPRPSRPAPSPVDRR